MEEQERSGATVTEAHPEASASGRDFRCRSANRASPQRPQLLPTARSASTISPRSNCEWAQVKVAENVKRADKLLRLEVDFGTEIRQMLAGIAESYTPESLVGTQSCDRCESCPQKTARTGVERNDCGRVAGGRKGRAGRLPGRCAGRDAIEIKQASLPAYPQVVPYDTTQ